MDEQLIALRREYSSADLNETDAAADPLVQFGNWMKHALAASVLDAEAMTLATVSDEGAPSVRIVLLRGYDQRGFSFYTNYESGKARELAQNPRCALVFFWPEIERQVRIQGVAQKMSPEESAAYFATRPRSSQLGAWASRQSEVLGSRQELEQRFASLEREYEGSRIPRPPNWGGYRIRPKVMEFWQGRPSRLHDRLRYTETAAGWNLERLAP